LKKPFEPFERFEPLERFFIYCKLKFFIPIIHNNFMNPTFKKVHSEILRGMKLSRCRKCGCMRGTLQNLQASLPILKIKDAKELLQSVNEWYGQLEPQEYPCFGCKYCIPPEAMTILTTKYPDLASSTLSSCEIKISDNSWPPVEGEYTVLDKSAPVAVSTLASVKLEEKLAKLKPAGLCIVGKTETENIGIDKIVKNVISNPAISFLVLAGEDSAGHQSGRTLLALWENGVDGDMRVIGSRGRRPILKNVTSSDVAAFRKQIQMRDMIGCKDTKAIAKSIGELSQKTASLQTASSCGCSCDCNTQSAAKPAISLSLRKPAAAIPKITAEKYSKAVKLDKAGYFVIIPSKKDGNILVEHYSYDNKLLRKIEGKNSRDIYFTIIHNNWVSELSHAAYLGKELARAEQSLKKGFKYVQDGA
jgi:tetrahydromethanopterin S-methyltransferase subunit A